MGMMGDGIRLFLSPASLGCLETLVARLETSTRSYVAPQINRDPSQAGRDGFYRKPPAVNAGRDANGRTIMTTTKKTFDVFRDDNGNVERVGTIDAIDAETAKAWAEQENNQNNSRSKFQTIWVEEK